MPVLFAKHRIFLTALVSLALSLSLPLWASTADDNDRPIITKRDDLPRHTYQLDLPVTALYANEHRDALLALSEALAADIENDLAHFDIRDDNTRQEFYSILGSAAALSGDWQAYLRYLEQRRELESKRANRLSMGLAGEAIARARINRDASPEAIAANLRERLETLPFPEIEANLTSLKGSTEILSRALVLGSLESRYQPVVDRNGGKISQDVAASLVSAWFTLDQFVRVAPAINRVLVETIAANSLEKKDIWEARKFALDEGADAVAVTIAVWDSGVDTGLFAASGQLWQNRDEVPANGQDDDGNGYVDDIHGIAYDLDANRVSGLLYPVGNVGDEEAMQRRVKGLGDIQYNVDSPAAAAVREQLASLPQAEVKDFLESLGAYGNFAHGSHVAGIALEGNPFARLLTARMTYGYTMIPEKPTIEQAHRDAAMMHDTIAYFQANGVRAVNMSWGGSLRSIESALEAHSVGDTSAERKALAREIYTISDTALREAIRDADDILFIISAGNADNDIRFDEYYPSSYDYPNVLTVGAVDSAGDETSFTSLGKVDIYANGYEVESYVPGGNRIPFSGTSMSSPQVTNLAAKLLALAPDLSLSELRELIVAGAEEKDLGERRILLMDPRASRQLLEASR